jgi:hypothetical protein
VSDAWFEDLPVIGAMPEEQARAKLAEFDESLPPAPAVDQAAFGFGDALKLRRALRPWQHTAHTFGFIGESAAGSTVPLPVVAAGNVPADESLRGARIKITLDRLRVADYPGGGMHQILFDFYAQNQVSGGVEHIHFNTSLRVQEGESVATVGYPIFSGLNVGSEGVAFKCFTVNVANADDEALLGFLDSDVFKTGLRLATAAQPVLLPFSEMAVGLTKSIARRHRNVPVQDFFLGLDFSSIPLRARLASGSYIAVQIPEALSTAWNWEEWVYLPTNGQIVHRADHMRVIPSNYVVFSVSRLAG